MKRALIIAAVLVAGFFLVWFWRRDQASPPLATAPAESLQPSPTAGTTGQPPAAGAVVDGPILLANDLNRPAGTIEKDLRILEDLLDAWRSNFPHSGNPWGENAEIAATLSGQNPLHLVLIPRNHVAFNRDGELCDRWGTPFRFHALSSTQMEVRSAGPDQRFGTADDATLTP